MHVDVNLGGRHLEKEQHHGIYGRRNDVAISLGERVLHDAVANEASVDEDKDGVAIELLNFGARDEAVQADLAGHRSLWFLLVVVYIILWLATPRWRLRQSDAIERQQRAEGDELVERLLAEHLIDALRVVGDGRRDEHGVGGGVQFPVHLGMRQRVVRDQRSDVRQLGGFGLQELAARRDVEE